MTFYLQSKKFLIVFEFEIVRCRVRISELADVYDSVLKNTVTNVSFLKKAADQTIHLRLSLATVFLYA